MEIKTVLEPGKHRVWMPFMDCEILMEYVPLEDMKKIAEEATESHFDGRRNVERYDALKADCLLGRRAVKDWRGLTLDGQPFPYSPENCDLLMMKWADFNRFVGNASVTIRKFVADRREQNEGNL